MATRIVAVQLSATTIVLWGVDRWLNNGEYARMVLRSLRQFGVL